MHRRCIERRVLSTAHASLKWHLSWTRGAAEQLCQQRISSALLNSLVGSLRREMERETCGELDI